MPKETDNRPLEAIFPPEPGCSESTPRSVEEPEAGPHDRHPDSCEAAVPEVEASSPVGEEVLDSSVADAQAPSLPPEELRSNIEALLYASGEPLSLRDLRKVLPEVEPEAIRSELRGLVESYRAEGRGLQIVEVAGGYQITTRPEFHDRVSRLFKFKAPARLSVQALETLAAIAYRQPVTVPEIMELRGVRSVSVVRTLLERKLIRIMGRKNVVGRPLLYGTTKEFLLRFGLRDLSELPRLEDIAEVFGEDVILQLGGVEYPRASGAGTHPDEVGEEAPQRPLDFDVTPDFPGESGEPDAEDPTSEEEPPSDD